MTRPLIYRKSQTPKIRRVELYRGAAPQRCPNHEIGINVADRDIKKVLLIAALRQAARNCCASVHRPDLGSKASPRMSVVHFAYSSRTCR